MGESTERYTYNLIYFIIIIERYSWTDSAYVR